jgi:hypothetical protein
VPPGYSQPYPPQYGQPYQQPYGQPYPPAKQGLPQGLAVGALIVGIIAVLGSWIPVAGGIIGLVAVILGIVAWRRASTGRGAGMAMAITGAILGLVAIVISVIATVFAIWFFTHTRECFDANLTDAQRTSCFDNAFND